MRLLTSALHQRGVPCVYLRGPCVTFQTSALLRTGRFEVRPSTPWVQRLCIHTTLSICRLSVASMWSSQAALLVPALPSVIELRQRSNSYAPSRVPLCLPRVAALECHRNDSTTSGLSLDLKLARSLLQVPQNIEAASRSNQSCQKVRALSPWSIHFLNSSRCAVSRDVAPPER